MQTNSKFPSISLVKYLISFIDSHTWLQTILFVSSYYAFVKFRVVPHNQSRNLMRFNCTEGERHMWNTKSEPQKQWHWSRILVYYYYTCPRHPGTWLHIMNLGNVQNGNGYIVFEHLITIYSDIIIIPITFMILSSIWKE